jgi:hypothetical protein
MPVEDQRKNLQVRIDLVAIYELTPSELKLYVHYIRRAGFGHGACTESIATTSEWVGMNVKTVRGLRDSLIQKQFIAMENRYANQAQLTNVIVILDVTERNIQFYDDRLKPSTVVDKMSNPLPKSGTPPSQKVGPPPSQKVGPEESKDKESKDKDSPEGENVFFPLDKPLKEKPEKTADAAKAGRLWLMAEAIASINTDNPTPEQIKTRMATAKALDKAIEDVTGDELKNALDWFWSTKPDNRKYTPQTADKLAVLVADYRASQNEEDNQASFSAQFSDYRKVGN